jgi:hypothetical protein
LNTRAPNYQLVRLRGADFGLRFLKNCYGDLHVLSGHSERAASGLSPHQSVREGTEVFGQGNLIDSFRDADKRGAGVSRMRAN